MIKEGRKTFELRRGRVGIVAGDMVFFYATLPVSAIVAAGRVKRVLSASPNTLVRLVGRHSGLSEREMLSYLSGRPLGSAMELSDLVEWRTPIDPALHLANGSAFVPPQSYRYLNVGELKLLSDRLGSAVAIPQVRRE
jgi:predicted transcriptional regulator